MEITDRYIDENFSAEAAMGRMTAGQNGLTSEQAGIAVTRLNTAGFDAGALEELRIQARIAMHNTPNVTAEDRRVAARTAVEVSARLLALQGIDPFEDETAAAGLQGFGAGAHAPDGDNSQIIETSLSPEQEAENEKRARERGVNKRIEQDKAAHRARLDEKHSVHNQDPTRYRMDPDIPVGNHRMTPTMPNDMKRSPNESTVKKA